MWYVMENIQQSYELSDRLIRAISNWQDLTHHEMDDVEQLLEEGADVNRLHGTLLPLQVASMVSDAYCVQLLLEHGAKVNGPDGFGRAALHYAAEKDEACLELLLANGAEPNIRDSNQDTALHWASYKNNARCVRTLLQNGADVNAVDYNNATPVSWAAMKGNLESMKVLLEYNASVDICDYTGQSPLMRAASIQATGLNTDKDDACLELLLKAQGQFDLRDENGSFPNMVSRDNKLQELLQPYCCNTRTLQDLCRFAVRQYIGQGYLINIIPKLPIPASLQEFVLLQR